jgi:hypothetical protein
MEKTLKFNSQIATSRVQSERLLALGLKKETADMIWLDQALTDDYEDWRAIPIYKDWEEWQKDGIPAWSLGRLLEICGEDRLPISFHKKGKVKIRVNHIHPTHDGRSGYNYYNSLIDCIEWLINEGYFNHKYLNKEE